MVVYASRDHVLCDIFTAAAGVGDLTVKPVASSEWCGYDSGDRRTSLSGGYDKYEYISVTRDGSVWLRVGADDSQFDWTLDDVRRPRVQTPVITEDMLDVLRSTTATEYCVLTDLDLRLTVQGAWHPSYLTFYDPSLAQTRIVSIRVSNNTRYYYYYCCYYHYYTITCLK